MKVAEFKLNYNNLILQFEGETGKKAIWGNKQTKQFIKWVEKREKKRKKEQFFYDLIEFDEKQPYKISARGWCYLLENMNIIDKSQFDKIQKKINDSRKTGILPLDFTAEDKSRAFSFVEPITIEHEKTIDFIQRYINDSKNLHKYKNDFTFWKTQKYYIQMLVEKVDVFNVFYEICKKYHIPLANAKGWSSLNMRNNIVLRFKEAEEMGLIPVFLYYGDFDAGGLNIINTFRKNIHDIKKKTEWDGLNLIINPFGLTKEFIDWKGLTWIDNLITSKGRNLGELYDKYIKGTLGKKDRIFKYEIEYIEKYGKRKCESNAILPIRDVAIAHCDSVIRSYLGKLPLKQYRKGLRIIRKKVQDKLIEIGFYDTLKKLGEKLNQDE